MSKETSQQTASAREEPESGGRIKLKIELKLRGKNGKHEQVTETYGERLCVFGHNSEGLT